MEYRFGSIALAMIVAGTMLPAVAAPAQRKADGPAASSADPLENGAQAWDQGNYARALAIWRPLAAAGNPNAQYNLGQAYRLGHGVTIDKKVAQDWYYRAAQQNHREATTNYGLMLFDNGDRRNALTWLRKGADRGDPRAQYVVGTALFNGDTVPRDWVRAYAMMTRAAAAGIPAAMKSLSEMDRYVPLDQRTQGTAIARDMERSATLQKVDEDAGQLVRAEPAPVAPVAGAATQPARPVKEPVKALVKAPVAPSPQPAPVAAQPLRAAADGGWRVQVGAYGDPAAAGKVWDGIARKAPGLGLRSYLVKAGAVTRLQAGPLASRADANKACARIKAAGADCFPVAAK